MSLLLSLAFPFRISAIHRLKLVDRVRAPQLAESNAGRGIAAGKSKMFTAR